MRTFHALIATLLLLSIQTVSAQVVIRGRVLAHDGSVLPAAHIHFKGTYQSQPELHIPARPDGSFEILTHRSGGYMTCWFTGVNHQDTRVDFGAYPNDTVDLTIRLATALHAVSESKPEAVVFVDTQQIVVPLVRNAAGVLTARVPARGEMVKYQIRVSGKGERGLEERTVNGSFSDAYEYDMGGDYFSLVRATGDSVDIGVNPASLPPRSLPAQITFACDTCFSRRMHRFHNIFTQRAINGMSRVRKREYLDSLRTLPFTATTVEEAVTNALVILSYDTIDRTRAHYLVTQAGPSAAVWSGYGDKLYRLLSLAGFNAAERRAYIDRVRTEHADSTHATALLQIAFDNAWGMGDTVRAGEFDSILQTAYPGFLATRQVAADLGRVGPLVGSNAPDFSFVELRSKKEMKLSELKGKVVVIDFWATWCGPCHAQFPTFRQLRERYGDSVEIVSLAVNDSREKVEEFVARKNDMPWPIGYYEGAWDVGVAKTYGVSWLPWIIVVDQQGVVRVKNYQGKALADAVESLVAGVRRR